MRTDLLSVSLDFGDIKHKVGRLLYRERQIYFQYEPSFLASGLNISPFYLPLKEELATFRPEIFSGLAGVFNDSLPDGWGKLLLDRSLRAKGEDPFSLTPLDRLAFVGSKGIGALCYTPEIEIADEKSEIILDNLFSDVMAVSEGGADDILCELIALNGSSAGARPKALIGVNHGKTHIIHGTDKLTEDHEHWIVKFPNTQDGADSGAVEYVYSLMARSAGVEVEPTHLFCSAHTAGFFATKRFDRDGNDRLHIHSACGLLHSDFRLPSMDYKDLAKAALILTKDIREVEKVYRLAVFNVLAHNRDDHSKNFSFLMNNKGDWRFAPAYDLTFSSGPRGEQSTMVMGEGRKPNITHLTALAEVIGIKRKEADNIIRQVADSVAKWHILAEEYGVTKKRIDEIEKRLINLK